MALRRRARKKSEAQELELTTFLNLMVVLISFLLVTAVFSRIAIQELKLPTGSGGAKADKPIVTIEVIVRKKGLEIGDGRRVLSAIPRADDKYDLAKLSLQLQNLKEKYKDKTDATLLSEADISYEDVIGVMDAVKVARIKREGQEEPEIKVLFPDVSLGDAP